MTSEHKDSTESFEHLEHFFSQSTDFLCTTDLNGKVMSINPSFLAFLGSSQQERQFNNFFDLLELGETQQNYKSIEDLFLQTRRSEVCVRMPSRSGGLRTVVWKLSLDAKGKTILAVGRDLTEMTKTRKRLEDVQRIAQVGSFEYDVATGKMSWSQEMFKIFPDVFNTEHLSLQDLSKKVHEDDRESFTAAYQKALSDGISFKLLFRTHYEFEQKWIEAICTPETDTQRRVTALVGTYQNVTDRIANENEHKLVIEALNIGVWKYNCVTQSLHWDQSMYRLYGINESSFSGHYDAWASSLTPETRAAAEQAIKDARDGVKDFDTTFEIQLPNQGRRTIGARAQVIRDGNGQALWMYGVNWDRTTEFKLAQSLEESRASAQQNSKLALLGEMAGGIAHEINNPLTIISGKAEVLLRKAIDGKLDNEYAAKSAEMILKTAQRIAKIVKGLRTFSRNSDNDPKQTCEVSSIVTDCLELCQEKFKNNGVEIIVNVPDNLKIWANPTQIGQVLMNLISNAYDAIFENEQRWVKLEATQAEGKVRLAVTDSGNGIAPEIAAKIMMPFFTTKKAGAGTGIGLSIISNIAKDHKANFFYDSKNPHTSFVIEFPPIEAVQNPKESSDSGLKGAA